MFGMKTLVVGGGAVALLWMMNTHASAGDLVDNVKNGASTVSNGYQSAAERIPERVHRRLERAGCTEHRELGCEFWPELRCQCRCRLQC